MPPSTLGLIELLLVFGGVIGWALWQWWQMRRWRRERDAQRPPALGDEGH
jgi:hypothetical protein